VNQISLDPLLQASSVLLSSKSRDLEIKELSYAYIKHPYICVMTFAHAALLLMWNWGPSLHDIMEVPSEAAALREEWSKNPGVRRNFFTDIGLSALNLIETTPWAHNDIRLPNITWNSKHKSFCLIDFDNCTEQVVKCNILGGIDPSTQVGLMIFTVVQIALVVWDLDRDDAREELSSCRKLLFGSDSARLLTLPKLKEWIETKSTLNRVFSSTMELPVTAEIHPVLKVNIREWGKEEFMLVLSDTLQISEIPSAAAHFNARSGDSAE
jgi:hypothetical protein